MTKYQEYILNKFSEYPWLHSSVFGCIYLTDSNFVSSYLMITCEDKILFYYRQPKLEHFIKEEEILKYVKIHKMSNFE